jgi:signal peptidase I
MPGDLVEIRKGILYLNGVDVDKDLNLTHIFKVDRSDSAAIRYDPLLSYTIPAYPDVVYVTLADNYVREAALPCQQHVLPPGLRSGRIYNVYKKNWNEDNFGPVKVPPGKWFVLGDDRGHSIDSRHLGFIGQRSYAGVVL